ncbi:MAG: hypothetical protein CMJ49_02615 [Planctomycetaceae bacterium]|nr:hypothetical protein [Planctomycetaceae bacterium]
MIRRGPDPAANNHRARITGILMKSHAAALILLALITAAVFARAVRYEFISWDDPEYVYENPHVRDGLNWAGIKWLITEQPFERDHPLRAWHPLTGFSHMLDCQLFGLNPAGHHAVNIIFHVINALLLYAVIASLTGRRWAAWVIAALFALHPLRVESVAWVAERKDVLSGCFGLLTLWAYVHYTRRPAIARYLLVWSLLALGLMTKPMLVTWPALLILLDYWPLRRVRIFQPHPALAGENAGTTAQPPHRTHAIGWLILEKLPLLALSFASAISTYFFQFSTRSTAAGHLLPLTQSLANAIVSCVRYLGKTFWPSDLGLLYPHPYLPGGEPWAAWQIVGAAALLLIVTALCLWQARRRAYLIVGWLWYLGTLVPVLGIAQAGSQAMADRFTYLPAIGIAVMLVFAAREIITTAQHRRRAQTVSAALTAIVLITCAALSFHQTGFWKNSITVFSHAIDVAPNAVVMHKKLGDRHWRKWMELSNPADSQPPDPDRAEPHFDRALARYAEAVRRAPIVPDYRTNLSVMLISAGQTDRAIRHLHAALNHLPPGSTSHARIIDNLANALARTDRIDQAIETLEQALQLDTPAQHLRAADQMLRTARRKMDRDIAQLQTQLNDQPDNIPIMSDLAALFVKRGQSRRAIDLYQQITVLHPTNAEAHYRLGTLLDAQHQFDAAVESMATAAQLQPGAPAPLNAAAWSLATRPDRTAQHAQRALDLAQSACDIINHQTPGYLDTLAAAHAAAGNFADARRIAQRAADLAAAQGEIKLARRIRYHLAQFNQRKSIQRRPANQ